MKHIKRLDEMMNTKQYYLYMGYHVVYMSDTKIGATDPLGVYDTFEEALDAASEYDKDIIYSDNIKDEVCAYFGDRDYCRDNPDYFFNPNEPIR